MSYFTPSNENEIIEKIKGNNWFWLKQWRNNKIIFLCINDSKRQKWVKCFPKQSRIHCRIDLFEPIFGDNLNIIDYVQSCTTNCEQQYFCQKINWTICFPLKESTVDMAADKKNTWTIFVCLEISGKNNCMSIALNSNSTKLHVFSFEYKTVIIQRLRLKIEFKWTIIAYKLEFVLKEGLPVLL